MIIGQKSEVAFKVNVMGTSSEPTARVIIETQPHLSFPAVKSTQGDWVAVVDVPSMIAPGAYKMRVEVVVNTRLFTPYQKMVDITAVETPGVVPNPVPSVEPVAALNAAPAPQPDIPVTLSPIEQAEEPAYEEVAVEALAPVQAEAPAEAQAPVEAKKITLPADFFKFELRDSAPKVTIASKPIIKTLASECMTPVKKVVAAKRPKKIVEIKPDMPVTLSKGEVIYE